jgi:hypothetical protein
MTGKFNETKKDFMAKIKLAVPEATVEGNWRQDIGNMVRNLPFVTVRLSEVLSEVYDRDIGESSSGSIADYHFSAYVFHSNCNDAGEEKGKHAQDVADRIMSYFEKQPSCIGFDVYDTTARESEPERGASRISRVIVEGQLHIKRID